MRDSPGAVPLRTSLGQGNGKNLVPRLPTAHCRTFESLNARRAVSHRVVRIYRAISGCIRLLSIDGRGSYFIIGGYRTSNPLKQLTSNDIHGCTNLQRLDLLRSFASQWSWRLNCRPFPNDREPEKLSFSWLASEPMARVSQSAIAFFWVFRNPNIDQCVPS